MSDQHDNRAPGGNALREPRIPALSRCLSLDLEVGRNDGRIHALAGVRPDTDTSFTFNRRRGLPHLSATNPNLRLLQLPAVDTLRLNPLAFPRNPYHYLVKHYQDGPLRRGRLNDPRTGRPPGTGGFRRPAEGIPRAVRRRGRPDTPQRGTDALADTSRQPNRHLERLPQDTPAAWLFVAPAARLYSLWH